MLRLLLPLSWSTTVPDSPETVPPTEKADGPGEVTSSSSLWHAPRTLASATAARAAAHRRIPRVADAIPPPPEKDAPLSPGWSRRVYPPVGRVTLLFSEQSAPLSRRRTDYADADDPPRGISA